MLKRILLSLLLGFATFLIYPILILAVTIIFLPYAQAAAANKGDAGSERSY